MVNKNLTMSHAKLSSSAVYTQTPYNLIINSFHTLPHLNMWFALSNSTFDPNNSDYLEVNYYYEFKKQNI